MNTTADSAAPPLTPPQRDLCNLMQELDGKGVYPSSREMARIMGKSQVSVWEMLQRLVRHGWVERSRSSRRRYVYRLRGTCPTCGRRH